MMQFITDHALSPAAFFLLGVCLILWGVRRWTARLRFGIGLVAIGLTAASAPSVVPIPIALTNAALLQLPASVGFIPIARFGVNSIGDAPLSWWYAQTGTCSANSMTADVGSCNNDPLGNSFYAVQPLGGMDIRQWGASVTASAAANTTAINAAFALGTQLSAPSGTFQITTLNAPAANTVLSGAMELDTVFETTSATGDVLPLTAGNVSLYRIGFSSSVTRTGGCYFHISAGNIFVDHFYMNGAFCAFQEDDATSINSVDHGYIYDSVSSGQSIVVFGSGTGTGLTDSYFGHTIINGGTISANNIDIVNVGDLVLDDVQSIGATDDLLVNPGTGQAVVTLKCSNSFFDHGATNFKAAISGSGVFARSSFVNCWFGSGTTNAVDFEGGSGSGYIDGITFTGNQMVLSSGSGLVLSGNVKNITGHDNLIAQNVDGIYDDRNTGFNNAILSGNIVGAGGGLTGNTLGFSGNGAGDYLTLTDNNFQGNTTASSSSNTGTHNRVENNSGINPIGHSVPSVGASPWTFTNGSTPSTLYLFGGTVSSITLNGAAIFNAAGSPLVIPLSPNDVVVTTYSVAPTPNLFVQ